jgi:NADH-quinone oxidoreductase subunit G
MAVNAMDYDFHFEVAHRIIAAPPHLPAALASVVAAAHEAGGLPTDLAAWAGQDRSDAGGQIARMLAEAGEGAVVLLGNAAASHAQASVLKSMVQALAQKTGASWGCLSEGNGAAAWVAGCVPHRTAHGQAAAEAEGSPANAYEITRDPRRGYLLLNVEPALDCADGRAADEAMRAADCVVALTAFDIRDSVDADVMLPVTPYSETSGSYVNCEGRLQSVAAAVAPQGEARPAWKVLRVLGNLFDAPGFDYVTSEDVRDEIAWSEDLVSLDATRPDAHAPADEEEPAGGLARIGDVPLYRTDPLVRRAGALQRTGDNPPAMARLCREEALKLGVADDDRVRVSANRASVSLPVRIDDAVPAGSVCVPAGWESTAPLGSAPFLRIEKA